MTTTDLTAPAGLERLISACFEGGERLCRELRLTDREAQYLRETCPAALRPMGEQWYEITFQGAMNHGN